MNHRIVAPQKILALVKELRQQKKKIVTYNGTFDILHYGHVKSIIEAKKQGDILILLLNSDKSIKMYKGPTRPIITESERAKIIVALNAVDYVVIFDEINPKNIIAKIKPQVHCSGSDWGKNCVERDIVEKNGGKIHVLKWKKGLSTTSIIERMHKINKKPAPRAIFLDRDGTINDNKNGFVHRISDFEFLSGSLVALKKLSKTDYLIFIVANQSGIGRGMYTDGKFQELNKWMINKFKKESIRIDKIYYCPHVPDVKCECRKPGIGMFLSAVSDFGVNLSESWLIGDDERDVIAGREANMKTIKIGGRINKKIKLEPAYYSANLEEAIDYLLRF